MALHQFASVIVNLTLLTFVAELCIAVQLKLTNLECESLDSSLIDFPECRLKIIRRGVPALNISAELLRPFKDIGVNFAIYKKASGYKPFLYNISGDFCRFMQNCGKHMLSKIVYKFIAEYSNINHTCPYYGAVKVENLVLTEDKFRLIPFPSGEYMLKMLITDVQKRIARIHVYFSRIE